MKCYYCGATKHLRPYGPNHSMVCFTCATATPEREAEAKKNFLAQLAAIDGPAVLDGSSAGPYPADHNPLVKRILKKLT